MLHFFFFSENVMVDVTTGHFQAYYNLLLSVVS